MFFNYFTHRTPYLFSPQSTQLPHQDGVPPQEQPQQSYGASQLPQQLQLQQVTGQPQLQATFSGSPELRPDQQTWFSQQEEFLPTRDETSELSQEHQQQQLGLPPQLPLQLTHAQSHLPLPPQPHQLPQVLPTQHLVSPSLQPQQLKSPSQQLYPSLPAQPPLPQEHLQQKLGLQPQPAHQQSYSQFETRSRTQPEKSMNLSQQPSQAAYQEEKQSSFPNKQLLEFHSPVNPLQARSSIINPTRLPLPGIVQTNNQMLDVDSDEFFSASPNTTSTSTSSSVFGNSSVTQGASTQKPILSKLTDEQISLILASLFNSNEKDEIPLNMSEKYPLVKFLLGSSTWQDLGRRFFSVFPLNQLSLNEKALAASPINRKQDQPLALPTKKRKRRPEKKTTDKTSSNARSVATSITTQGPQWKRFKFTQCARERAKTIQIEGLSRECIRRFINYYERCQKDHKKIVLEKAVEEINTWSRHNKTPECTLNQIQSLVVALGITPRSDQPPPQHNSIPEHH